MNTIITNNNETTDTVEPMKIDSIKLPGVKTVLTASKFGSTDSINLSEEMEMITEGNGSLSRARKLAKELQTLADSKTNLHGTIKSMINKVIIALAGADLEHKSLINELKSAKDKLAILKSYGSETVKPRTKRKLESPETCDTPTSTRGRTQPPKNDWQQVKGRKTPKARETVKPKESRETRLKRPRADALVIGLDKDKPEMYAEVLKKIKNDQSLKEMGDNVMGVRKTRNGDLLIELKADPKVSSTKYRETIGKAIVDVGIPLTNVKALSQVTLLECRNLDDVTSEEELRDAIKKEFLLTADQFNGPIRLRKSYNSTQIATFKATDEEAKLMITRGKVKVGWSVCVLRIPKEPIRCHKCLGFGHMKGSCKGEDRSKACWKCGTDGHKSKDCRNNPRCLLCPAEGDRNHATGSFKCKAYKEALAKVVCK
jgi:hypothetical protein